MPNRNAPMTLEQQRELHSQIVHGAPTDLTFEIYDYWTTHGAELNTTLREALSKIPQPVVARLLELVKSVSLPAIPAFLPKRYLVEGEIGGVKIGWLGDNLKNLIRKVRGKEEPAITSPTTLRVHRLKQSSLDAQILAELGETARTSFGLMWKMMEAQGHGEPGDLLVNGKSNIFYPVSAPDWAVYCRWFADNGYWLVNAYSISGPHGWDDGRRVLSR